MTQPIRAVSKTGGEKEVKLAKLGAIDPQSLMVLAEVAGFGAEKYSRYNMLRGYDWSLSYDALQRHLHAFWAGEENDPESGLPHLAHAAWHCMTLTSFLQRGLGTDDRYKQDSAASDVFAKAAAPQKILHCEVLLRHEGHVWSNAADNVFTCPGRS